jgi:hypothetical protein
MQRASTWVGIRVGFVLALSVGAAVPLACFKGADREKEAPPGNVGGLCLAPDGRCKEGECNKDENYCFDRASPCRGFFCGGTDRGTCIIDDLQPSCVCAGGYNNDDFALYCCPDDPMLDPENCLSPDGGDDDESEDGGDESSSSSGVG